MASRLILILILPPFSTIFFLASITPSPPTIPMKIPSFPNPKRLLRSIRGRQISRSPPSFSSASSSSSFSDVSATARIPTNGGRSSTPKSVLPSDDNRFLAGDIAQAFKFIDRDGDGKITKKELLSLILRLSKDPLSEEELSEMLMEVEIDDDGLICLDRLGSAISLSPPPCTAEIKGVFDFFDQDGDGRITERELLKVFESIGDDRCTAEECGMMIRGVNCNGDGFVSFEDFHRLMVEQLQC